MAKNTETSTNNASTASTFEPETNLKAAFMQAGLVKRVIGAVERTQQKADTLTEIGKNLEDQNKGGSFVQTAVKADQTIATLLGNIARDLNKAEEAAADREADAADRASKEKVAELNLRKTAIQKGADWEAPATDEVPAEVVEATQNAEVPAESK